MSLALTLTLTTLTTPTFVRRHPLLQVDQDYETGLFESDDAYLIARDQYIQHGLECITCPDACVDCFTIPTMIKPGFSVSSAGDHYNKTLLRCRPETSHKDAFGAGELASNASGGKYQCRGGPLDPMKLTCAPGHEGALCGACSKGWGRKSENECHRCDEAVDPMQVGQLMLYMTAFGSVLSLLLVGLSFYVGDVYYDTDINIMPTVNLRGSLHLDEATTVNPLKTSMPFIADSDGDDPKRVVSYARVFETSKHILMSGILLSVQPVKIFLGYFQIAVSSQATIQLLATSRALLTHCL